MQSSPGIIFHAKKHISVLPECLHDSKIQAEPLFDNILTVSGPCHRNSAVLILNNIVASEVS